MDDNAMIDTEDDGRGRCCANCLYYRDFDGDWCVMARDDYDNVVWVEVNNPEKHDCIYWESI